MEIDDGLGAFSGLQEGYVVFIILEEILGEDGRAAGVAEDVEVALDIRITIRVVFTEPMAGEPVSFEKANAPVVRPEAFLEVTKRNRIAVAGFAELCLTTRP